ncbi:hypothetical protein PMKS-000277 [Pichia membranifaciens]|uniref:Uncharacterized protein n=1 Tax=Pichia membranifaciens TaxID=4926 RepID=A0A1Q2YBE1_9ASCO|nr:hypothetical protein PMKS-000277 [Pichia membranifaciens]
MENMTANGLQATYTLRQQQPHAPDRAMSLSSRSFRPSEQPRTMSMRSGVYSHQPGSRTMSMTASSRPNRPSSINSRANSLTASARAYQKNSGSRLNSMSGSRVGSRANSLTPSTAGNASHTTIIKTTKEKDYSGRTKSITTTTIEKRGNMKIVRTTVIHPSDQRINEDAELEELAELEDFDHDATLDEYNHNDGAANYHEPDGHLAQYDYQNQYDEDYSDMIVNENGDDVGNYNDRDYYEDPVRNGAALAAAVALNGNQRYPDRPQPYSQVQRNTRQKPASSSQRVGKNRREIQNYDTKPEVRFGESAIVNDVQRENYDYPHDNQNEPNSDLNQQQHQSEVTRKSKSKSTKLSKQKAKPAAAGAINPRNAHKNQAIAAANSPSTGTPSPSNRTRKLDPPHNTHVQQSVKSQSSLSADGTPSKTNVLSRDNDILPHEQQQILSPAQSSRAHFNDVANDVMSDEIYEDNVGEYDDEGADDDEENVMVVTPEMSSSESFKARAQKRLSEIAEVTETYDDDEVNVESDQDFMEEPILNPLGLDTAIPIEGDDRDKTFEGRATLKDSVTPRMEDHSTFVKPALVDNAGTTASSITSDENFVEAQEDIVSNPPAITDINDKGGIARNQSRPINNKSSQPQASHTYRNLLFNEPKRSPIKNSIPNFNGVHNDYVNDDSLNYPQQLSAVSSQSNSPVVNQNSNFNNFSNFDQNEDGVYAPPIDRQPKKSKLKSALKNSSSSLASPVSETNPKHSGYAKGQRMRSQSKKPISSPIENTRKELTPEEMYALALKAAEKKVYGDRLSTVYPDNDIDDDTKLNTMVNMQGPPGTEQAPIPNHATGVIDTSDQRQAPSQPGLPYKSNATGLGFRVHSLRDSNSSTKQLKKTDPQEASRLKKIFKLEQKQQRKLWEDERKAAAGSRLVQQAQQKVEKDVSLMPVDPDVELHILQQQEQVRHEQNKLEQLKQQQLQHQQDGTPAQNQTQQFDSSQVSNAPPAQTNIFSPVTEYQTETPVVEQETQQPSVPKLQEPISQQSIQPTPINEPVAETTAKATAGDTSPNSSSATNSPNKLRVKMFSFGKKKSTSDHYTHKKQTSLVSQETHRSTASVGRRGSVDGKRSKFFSFGLGGSSHDADPAPVQSTNQIQKVKSIPGPEHVGRVQNVSVSDYAQNEHPVPSTQDVPEVQQAQNISDAQTYPAAGEVGSAQGIVNNLTGPETENHGNVQSQTAWPQNDQPLKSAEITTIPEDVNDTPTALGNIEEENFAQPTYPGVRTTNDNFVRGPHGSSSNLMKVGTVNSSVTNGSVYTNNNLSVGNPDSMNPTDSSKLASSEAQNFAFSTPTNGVANSETRYEEAQNGEAAGGAKQQHFTDNSSIGEKAGKSPKAGRKFMKFFNL